MSLFNLLVHLPHERLRSLANEFGISSASPSKRTILNDLTARYRDERFISVLVDELPEETKGLLRGLVFFTPETESISIPDPLRAAWRGSLTLEEQLTPLLDLGLLFSESSKDCEQLILPEEIRNTLRSLFLAPYRKLSPQGEMALDGMTHLHPGLEAVYHLLCVVLHHRTIQTQKGTIHRKSVERWGLRLDAEPREDFFQFVFEFCRDNGLLSVSKNRYRPTAKVAEWFSRDEKVLRNDLWAYYLKTRLFPDRSLQMLPAILRSAEKWIADNQKAPVFSIGDIYSLMGDGTSSERLIDCLEWLQFFGLLRLNDPEMPTTFYPTLDGIEILCRSELPEPEPLPADFCVLQPNFDLLAPPVVGYPQLWKLEHLAEFKRRDVFTEYHISQQSILFGMRRGWKRESVMEFFDRLTGNRLSGNVRYSLEEWCNKYGQITLRRIVLVECATAELAEEMSHVPDLTGMLDRRISDRCFAVSESNARAVLKILRERGYEPSAAKRLTDEE